MVRQQGHRTLIAAAAICLLLGLAAGQPRPPQNNGPRGPGGQLKPASHKLSNWTLALRHIVIPLLQAWEGNRELTCALFGP